MTARYVARRINVDTQPLRKFRDLVDENGILRMLTGDDGLRWKEAPPGERGMDVSKVRFEGLAKRDLSIIGGDDVGGYLADPGQPVEYVEAVGNRMVVRAAGGQVRYLPKLLPIPTVTSDGEVYHPVEGQPIQAANIQFGRINPHPYCAGVSADFSRLLATPIDPFSEQVIAETVAGRSARAVDNDAISGSGVDGEPIGLLNAGISSTDGSTFSITTLAEMRRILADSHFVPTAALGNAATEKILRTREKTADSGIFLLGDDGKLSGVPFLVTEAMDDATLLLGDFGQLLLLIRSIQIQRNPYSRAREGMIELDQFTFFDVVVRHLAAFCKAVDVS